MEKKFSLILDKEFIDYCILNNIDDIEGTAKKTFNIGFTTLKYGSKPQITEGKEKTKIVSSSRPEVTSVPQKEKTNSLYDE